MFRDFLAMIFQGVASVYTTMTTVELMEVGGETITLFDAVFSVLLLFAVTRLFFGGYIDDDD